MKRWPIIVLAVITTIAVAIGVGYHIGAKLLRGKIVEALGPGSRVAALKVNWFTVELLGLTIDAPKGWPAARTLEAERVTIVPDLRSLLSDNIRISSIVVHRPYLSMLRTQGKLRLVPSLTEDNTTSQLKRDISRAVTISTIELKDGSLELFDTTVSRPALKITMERIEATIRDVAAPAAEKTRFELTGIVKGIIRDGRAKLSGWVGPSAQNSSSRVALAGVDMVALQPYLVKKNEARIASGSLDLNLDSEVRNHQLDGKGRIIIKDLELARSQRFLDTFMGLPRSAVIGFLKDHNNAIDVAFTLRGDTSNPNFSLNEDLPTRIAVSMAGTLGVSIINVAEGLGSLGRKGMESAGSVVEGVGSAIKGLFGSKR
jgi:hypothetical protein